MKKKEFKYADRRTWLGEQFSNILAIALAWLVRNKNHDCLSVSCCREEEWIL